ncbi:VCBS repeat-containing protein, partial [bacterium]|nr:VCBS repeat-containing protein [bacterium]
YEAYNQESKVESPKSKGEEDDISFLALPSDLNSTFSSYSLPTSNFQLPASKSSASAASTVFIGSDANSLHAIDAVSGTQIWSYATGGQIRNGALLAGNGYLYFGSADDSLYCLNNNGTKRWSYGTGGDIYMSNAAMAIDGSVYIGSYDNKLYAVGEYLEVVNPVLVSTYPTIHSCTAPVDTTLEIKFNTNLNMFTVDENTVHVSGNFHGSYECTFDWRASDSTLLIDPVDDFFHGEEITVLLTDGIKSVSGGVASNYRLSFTTGTVAKEGELETIPSWVSSEYGDYHYWQDAIMVDLNGDDFNDIVAFAGQAPKPEFSQGLVVYLSSKGTFTSDPTYVVSLGENGFGRLAKTDFDKDGDFDILVTINDKAKLFQNLSGILLSTPVWEYIFSTGDLYGSAFGILGDDIYPDLAIRSGTDVFIFENTIGSLASTPSWSNVVSEAFQNALWLDFDADADQDLIIGNEVFRNDSGSLTGPVQTITGYHYYGNMAGGDYNHDGYPELAAIDNGHVVVYKNNHGVFNFDPIWTNYEVQSASSCSWIDVNGDGYLDLSFIQSSPQSSLVFMNNKGVLEQNPGWASSVTGWTGRGDWGDMDNDGDMDLLITNGEGGFNERKLALFYNAEKPNNISPRILSIFPRQGAKSVSEDVEIILHFNDPLETGTVNTSNVIITGNASGQVSASLQLINENRTLSIIPTTDFQNEENISVVLSTNITSQSGGQLKPMYQSS